MRLAYSTLAYPRRTVEEAVPAAVRYGYHAIEWRLADGIIIDRGTPPTVRRRLCEVSAASGIAFACLDISYRIVQASPEECVSVTEGVQRMIDMADELGAPLLRVFGGRCHQEQRVPCCSRPRPKCCTPSAHMRLSTISLSYSKRMMPGPPVGTCCNFFETQLPHLPGSCGITTTRTGPVRFLLKVLFYSVQLLLMSMSNMVALAATQREPGNSAYSMKVRCLYVMPVQR